MSCTLFTHSETETSAPEWLAPTLCYHTPTWLRALISVPKDMNFVQEGGSFHGQLLYEIDLLTFS